MDNRTSDKTPILVLPPIKDHISQPIWRVAISFGIKTQRLEYTNNVFDTENHNYFYYGNLIDYKKYQVPCYTKLLPANFLPSLPYDLVKRKIQLVKSSQIKNLPNEKFFFKFPHEKWSMPYIGTVNDPLFPVEMANSEIESDIIVSEVVKFSLEYRFFVSTSLVPPDGIIDDFSQYKNANGEYEESGSIPYLIYVEARSIINRCLPFLSDHKGFVIDLGIVDGELVVVEANECWASGTYSCDPEEALRCMLAEQGYFDIYK